MFYAEIQDGRQKWWEKSPVDSADNLEGKKFRRNRSISHRFRDKCVSVFYAEIQEKDFWKKPPVNSGDILAIRNFNEIALPRIVSEINAFLRFKQKFKMVTKNGGKMIFGKSHHLTLQIPCLEVKNFDQITVSHTVSQINAFCSEIQDGHQKWQENDFWGNSPVDSGDTLALKNFNEIALSRTVFKIFTLFYFPLKFKMAAISCEN